MTLEEFYTEMIFKYKDHTPDDIHGVIVHVREPKESQQKTIQLLGFIANAEKTELCVLRNMILFIERTRHLRNGLPIDYTLFSTHLNSTSARYQPKSIQPSTLASWVKKHMKNAGINEPYLYICLA